MSERVLDLQTGDPILLAYTVALWRDSTDNVGLRVGMSLGLSRSCVSKDGKKKIARKMEGGTWVWEEAGPQLGCSMCMR